MCVGVPNTKFLGQGCQKLEHEQDRQTDRQTRPNALPAALLGDKNPQIAQILIKSNDDKSYDIRSVKSADAAVLTNDAWR